jgi:lysophospholipase L1-like esterase
VLAGVFGYSVGWTADEKETSERDAAGKTALGEPFWNAKKMEREPILFIQEEGKPVATGRLLFTPSAPPTLLEPDGKTPYVAGQDYVWTPGSNRIELTASSRIPFKTAAQMVPPAGSPNLLMGVLWAEGRFFHDLQALATYEHAETLDLSAPAQPERLARSLAKLKAKQPLKVVSLGDSITEGHNASGLQACLAPPYQPCYPQLVANTLAARFGAEVTLKNLGVAGTKADWGLTQVEKVAAEKPDLVLLAFGMNHSEPAADFEAVMRRLRDTVGSACPGADIVLIASMTGNPRIFPEERFHQYLGALRHLEGEHVAVADVTTPWLALLKRKPFSDLSGNNINHPNDFGHRFYAQVICGLFPVKDNAGK